MVHVLQKQTVEKIDGTKEFMTSINDNMYTDRSHKHTVYEVLLFMEMKLVYSFLTQEMKMDQIQNPLHCMRDGVSKSILQIIRHDIW